jgi:hypothetical protein
MIAHHIRRSCLAVLACGVVAATAHAQGAESFSRVAMDSEVSVRTTVTQDGKPQTNLMLDGVQNVHLFGGWTIISRPMATRRTGAEWAIHLAQFAVRHESTHGRVATRFEAGLLASPVGLGSLTARASDNPTITPSYSHSRGVTVEADAPGVQVLPLTYPVGAQFSMSTKVWDARVGVMDATPLRVRWPLEKDQPKPATHLLLAGGVTPRAGLRVGGWFMQGDWAKASEVARAPDRSRAASSGGVEIEYEVAWTRLAAEWAGSRLSTATGDATPATWMIEGLQTVSPRWFVAGRLRRAHAYSVPPRGFTGETTAAGLRSVAEQSREVVLGYRVSPDLTFRTGYLVVRAYGAAAWSHRAETSIVWARRWR